MTIRPELAGDEAAIRAVHLAAFVHQRYSQQTEHLIVEALRGDGALSVSLVAEVDGAVVGHIAFSPITNDGDQMAWYLLGPVGVVPAKQRQGIGSQLVLRGLESLRALGAEGCALVGDPAYYGRFGFRQASELVFGDYPAEACLWLPMTVSPPRGLVGYHAAFSIEPPRGS